jgi:hypothetical protein
MSKQKFNKELWAGIAQRLHELRGEQSVDDFLRVNNLQGLHWRIIEDGRQGLSVESLMRICDKLNVAPAWILFGIGHRRLRRVPAVEEILKFVEDMLLEVPEEIYDQIKQQMFATMKRAYEEQKQTEQEKGHSHGGKDRTRMPKKSAAGRPRKSAGPTSSDPGSSKKKNGSDGE